MLPSLLSSFRPSTSRYVVRRHLTAFSVVPLDVVVFLARALQEVFPDLAMTFSLVCGISVQAYPGEEEQRTDDGDQTLCSF